MNKNMKDLNPVIAKQIGENLWESLEDEEDFKFESEMERDITYND
jgi:hypothetical protein